MTTHPPTVTFGCHTIPDFAIETLLLTTHQPLLRYVICEQPLSDLLYLCNATLKAFFALCFEHFLNQSTWSATICRKQILQIGHGSLDFEQTFPCQKSIAVRDFFAYSVVGKYDTAVKVTFLQPFLAKVLFFESSLIPYDWHC